MIIPANKKRLPIAVFIGFTISVLLMLIIIKTAKHFNDQAYNNTIYIITCIGLLFWVLRFTALAFLYYTKATFDKHAEFKITNDGIIDNLSIFSVGNVSWTEITDIKIVTLLKTDFLIICVADPQSFIDKKNFLKHKTLKSFLKKFGSPIVISQKRIDYNLNDLKNILINKKLNK
jgi:hypothetical protein